MKQWIKIASDYNSPFWRNYLWVKAIIKQQEIFDLTPAALAIQSEPRKMDYLFVPKTWQTVFKKLSKKVEADINYLEKILAKTVEIGERMNQYTESFVKKDLTKLTSGQLVVGYQKHAELNILEYAYGVILPYLDFQQYHYIEDKLKAILKARLKNDQEISRAFLIFTQPTEDSFAMEQEKSILKIYQSVQDKKLFKLSSQEILEKIKLSSLAVYKKLKIHAKKYAWVFYAYGGPASTELDFIEIMKFYWQKKINPAAKLKLLVSERQQLLNQRKQFFAKMKLSATEERYVAIASRVVYLKPRRKDYQSKSYYHLEFLQKEIGRRLGWSLAQVRSATLEELKAALLGKKTDIDKINERRQFHIIAPVGNRAKIFQGASVVEWQIRNLNIEKVRLKNVKEINGQSVFLGKVTGLVRRIDLPEEMSKMKAGDILVSTATTPSIVPAIRKAAAIVTDEGGLTCHAAIMAREFQIPCVVGAKIATRGLKDGDKVSVDASNGKIRRIWSG